MDDFNSDNEDNKVYETEPGVSEDMGGFSAQVQKDKFLGGSSERPVRAVRRMFQPKSPEVIKSQLAAFTAETLPNHFDRKHVFSNLSSLAEENPESATRTTTRTEYDLDKDGKTVKVPSGTERLIATKEDYLQYLRSVSGSRFESIQGRTDMLTAYNQFTPEISSLKEELADPAKRKDNPAFLGAGSNSMVFRINRNGKDYAIRVPRGKDTDPLLIDSHLAGALLGRDIPHLEQIVAASYENGITIAEMIPGKEVGNLTVREIENISDSQLSELVDTLIVANGKGIEIDPKPSNFFYDAETGFGIVDYHSSKVIKNSEDQKVGKVVGWLSTVIGNAGFYGKRGRDRTVEEYSSSLAFHRINLDVLRRLGPIVETKLQGDNLREALESINSRIQSTEVSVERYSNPIWVSEQLKADEDQRRIWEEQKNKGTSNVITLDLV